MENHDDLLERRMQSIQKMRLLDDDFMKAVFKDNIPAVQLVLRIIMAKDDLIVKTVGIEDVVHNLKGKSIRIDVKAVDSEGSLYDIEIQRSDKGAGQHRARYNSSLMDAGTLLRGGDPEGLPNTYVIFITEGDPLGHNLPIYHIDRQVKETGAYFEDGTHIIYVNSNIQNDDALGKLMQDFWNTDPDTMNYHELSRESKRLKQTKEGVASMCRIVEQERMEGRAEGRVEGENKMAKLVELLLADVRFADAAIAAKDASAREALYREYGIV